MSRNGEFFDSLYGNWYPRDFVVGVADGLEPAARVVEALAAAGFGEERVEVHEGPEVLRFLRGAPGERGAGRELGTALRESITPEGLACQDYVERLGDGRALVGVRVADADDAVRAGALLGTAGVRAVKYYSPAGLVDLGLHPVEPAGS